MQQELRTENIKYTIAKIILYIVLICISAWLDSGEDSSKKRHKNNTIVVEWPTKKSTGLGTGFPINTTGTFLTAAHVVNKCDHMHVVLKDFMKKSAIKAKSFEISNNSDIAVIYLDPQKFDHLDKALEIAPYQNKHHDYRGYSIGYPNGMPGQTALKFIGEANMIARGGANFQERVDVWAIDQKFPNLASLGGHSGGPILNKNGQVIGILTSEDRRRGRVQSETTKNINRYISEKKLDANKGELYKPNKIINTNNYINVGDQLRKELLSTIMLCNLPNSMTESLEKLNKYQRKPYP